MIDLIMSAVIGLSDHTLLQWQTSKPYGYYCDVQVGAATKHLEIGANSELWSVAEAPYGVPIYAQYGVYAQYKVGVITARVQHTCMHHVDTGRYNKFLPYFNAPAYYQSAETRATVGVELRQRVWR
jgi:hypothetical protein